MSVDLHYYATLIAVADDCPVATSVVPQPRADKPTVAVVQYEMLVDDPYRYTQEDVLFESWFARQDGSQDRSGKDLARLRAAFFAKPQACLRSSPLPKKYGWGLRFDGEGRAALCPVESDEYRRVVAGQAGRVKVLKADGPY
jgi:hypothetical protein